MSIKKNTPNFLKTSKLPFTTILNEVINLIQDPGALGIYVYLSSKSEGWEINEKHLMNHFNIGRDLCNKKMKYLKAIGLIKVSSIRDSKGRITSWETELINQITENQYSGDEPSPQRSKSTSEKYKCTECEQYVNTRILKNHDVVNPGCGGSAPINKRGKEIKECECVCADAPIPHTQIFSQKTKALFEDKFGRYDVTIESLFDACSEYYEGKRKVTEEIFSRWIKMESTDNFNLKNARKTAITVNSDQIEKASLAKANKKAESFKDISKEQSIEMLKKFSQKITSQSKDKSSKLIDFGAISLHEVR